LVLRKDKVTHCCSDYY